MNGDTRARVPPAPMAQEGSVRSVKAPGSVFTCLEQGEGVPLVLLHGIGSGARSWRQQVASLSGRHRVIAWDAPGYGGSTALPMAQPDAGDYSDALVRFLSVMNVDRMHLVGHSLGAVMAARFAAVHPQRVLTLTLASIAGGHACLAEADRARLRDARLFDLVTLGVAGMAAKRGPRLLSEQASDAQRAAVIETMSQLRPDGFTQAVHMLSNADTRADVARLPAAMAVQIVYGDADVVTPSASIETIAAARPGVPVHVVPGGGHAFYIEQAEAFDTLLLRFIGT